MITLAAADTLAGNATAASLLTITVMGMELASGAETYKVLYQGQLPTSATTLYTVPGSTTAFIRSMSIVNNDSVAQSFQLFRGGTGASNAITASVAIPPAGAAYYEDGGGWTVLDSNGGVLARAGGAATESTYKINAAKAETIPRHLLMEVNTSALVSGRLQLQLIYLTAGTIVNSIIFWSATTAAGTPTHQIFGLYDASLNLLATTSDDTSTAWAANSQKVIGLSSPAQYTVPTSGLYYLGIMVTATTVPTLKGHTAPTAGTGPRGAAPIVCGTSSTGLTTALPNPAAAISVTNTPIWGAIN